MPGHIAKAGRGAEDNAIVIGQFLRAGYRRFLILLAAGFGKGFCRDGFRHAFQGHFNATDPASAFRYRLCQGFNMSVH